MNMLTYEPGYEIGDYRILSNPIVGGMGVVYLCHDIQNDRAVVLKTFKPEYLPDREARDRFLRESTAWVGLGSHPHIVRCHGVKYFAPSVFLILELIVKDDGRQDASLRAWTGSPLPMDQSLLFALQIARGMQHAVEKIPGFVHRDLKPENILVGKDQLPGMQVNRLRITDFGLASIFRDEVINGQKDTNPEIMRRTQLTHGLLGTPPYMAPEQWLNKPVGIYTDVYAFGCILFEMLTGALVAKGNNINDLKASHLSGNLNPIPGDVPITVSKLLARCLDLQSEKRFQTWSELTNAIEVIYSGLGFGVAPILVNMADNSLENQKAEAVSFMYIGLSYVDLGKAQLAIKYYEKALEINRKLGDLHGESSVLYIMGSAYMTMGDARQAIKSYEQSLEISRSIGDWSNWCETLASLGGSYTFLGDFHKAISCLNQSIKKSKDMGYRRNEYIALIMLGDTNNKIGDSQQAISSCEEALAIGHEIGFKDEMANALNILGSAYLNLSNSQKAIKYFEQSLEISQAIDDKGNEWSALLSLGGAYKISKDFQRAIGYYQKALLVSQKNGDRHKEGRSLGDLGLAHAELGNPQDAVGFYEKSVIVTQEIGDKRGERNALGNLGSVYQTLGDPRRAIVFLERSLVIDHEIGDKYGEEVDLNVLGQIYEKMGNVQGAIGYYEQRLVIARESGNLEGIANGSITLMILYVDLNDAKKALIYAKEAAPIYVQIGQTSKAETVQGFINKLQNFGSSGKR